MGGRFEWRPLGAGGAWQGLLAGRKPCQAVGERCASGSQGRAGGLGPVNLTHAVPLLTNGVTPPPGPVPSWSQPAVFDLRTGRWHLGSRVCTSQAGEVELRGPSPRCTPGVSVRFFNAPIPVMINKSWIISKGISNLLGRDHGIVSESLGKTQPSRGVAQLCPLFCCTEQAPLLSEAREPGLRDFPSLLTSLRCCGLKLCPGGIHFVPDEDSQSLYFIIV